MTSSPPDDPPSTTADDAGLGLVMFIVFTVAVLIVTGAVAALALVGTWWMLALMFAIDLGTTTIVIVMIAFVLDGRAQTIATGSRRLPAPEPTGDDRPPARIRPVPAA